MNKKLLQKVIDELAKDKPDLSYIRGMLETMMEMQEETIRIPMSKETVKTANDTLTNTLSAAEQAAMMAESGFVKGTNPGVASHAPVISNG